MLEAHAEEFLDAPEYQSNVEECLDTKPSSILSSPIDEQDSKNIEYNRIKLVHLFF